MDEHEVTYAPIRRVVTRHDANGKAVVWMDAPATNNQAGVRRATLMWATGPLPADFLTDDDAGEWELGTNPPPGGSRFTVIEYLPHVTYPALHRTDTIDYVICISGEIVMDLDDSSVTLRAGDVMVQLGTNHGWRNEGDVSAMLAFVLIDGAPKDSPTLPTTRKF